MRSLVNLLLIGVLLFSTYSYAGDLEQKPKDLRRTTINHHLYESRRRGEKAGPARLAGDVIRNMLRASPASREFSHLWVFYWFHENDNPEERRTLQVHPRRDPANPLTGVFACRAPVRPNLIGFTACRIIQVEGNVVEVADLDAQDGTPILDLKPYIPGGDAIPEAVTPEWLKRSRPPAD